MVSDLSAAVTHPATARHRIPDVSTKRGGVEPRHPTMMGVAARRGAAYRVLCRGCPLATAAVAGRVQVQSSRICRSGALRARTHGRQVTSAGDMSALSTNTRLPSQRLTAHRRAASTMCCWPICTSSPASSPKSSTTTRRRSRSVPGYTRNRHTDGDRSAVVRKLPLAFSITPSPLPAISQTQSPATRCATDALAPPHGQPSARRGSQRGTVCGRWRGPFRACDRRSR